MKDGSDFLSSFIGQCLDFRFGFAGAPTSTHLLMYRAVGGSSLVGWRGQLVLLNCNLFYVLLVVLVDYNLTFIMLYQY